MRAHVLCHAPPPAAAARIAPLRRLSTTCTPGRVQLTAKELYENAISWRDVFAEVAIKVVNSPLVAALMAHVDEHIALDAVAAARLRLNTQPFLEKQLDRIGDGIESLHMEVQDMTAYERARVRQEHQKALWLQRRQEVRGDPPFHPFPLLQVYFRLFCAPPACLPGSWWRCARAPAGHLVVASSAAG